LTKPESVPDPVAPFLAAVSNEIMNLAGELAFLHGTRKVIKFDGITSML